MYVDKLAQPAEVLDNNTDRSVRLDQTPAFQLRSGTADDPHHAHIVGDLTARHTDLRPTRLNLPAVSPGNEVCSIWTGTNKAKHNDPETIYN